MDPKELFLDQASKVTDKLDKFQTKLPDTLVAPFTELRLAIAELKIQAGIAIHDEMEKHQTTLHAWLADLEDNNGRLDQMLELF